MSGVFWSFFQKINKHLGSKMKKETKQFVFYSNLAKAVVVGVAALGSCALFAAAFWAAWTRLAPARSDSLIS